MSEERPPGSLKDLDERIRDARERRASKVKSGPLERGSGLSLALRIGVELVAAVSNAGGLGILPTFGAPKMRCARTSRRRER